MDGPHRKRAAAGYSLLVVAVLILASCEGERATNTRTDGPVATADAPPPEADRETQALPAGGPVDEIVPPGDLAYELLSQGRCDELKGAVSGWGPDVVEAETADTVELYRSAAHACLGEWDEAISAFRQIGSPPDLEGVCAREAVYRWLQGVVGARQADPQFDPQFVPSGQPNPCPAEPTTDATDGETGTDLDEEPTDGGETGVEGSPTTEETADPEGS